MAFLQGRGRRAAGPRPGAHAGGRARGGGRRPPRRRRAPRRPGAVLPSGAGAGHGGGADDRRGPREGAPGDEGGLPRVLGRLGEEARGPGRGGDGAGYGRYNIMLTLQHLTYNVMFNAYYIAL